jgi:hypothetical protein
LEVWELRLSKLLVSISLVVSIVLSINFEADAASAPIGVKWGNSILIQGQIGRVTILKDTDLLKKENDKLVIIKRLRKGSIYRVFSFKDQNGGIFGLGGGAFVKKTTSILYENPSKTKHDQLARVAFFNDKNFLPLAKEGIIKGQPISLRTHNLNDVFQYYHTNPSWEGYYEGGFGRQFGNYVYFTGGENDNTLTAVLWVNDNLVTLTPNIIKNTVGNPTSEGISDMDGNWYMYYDLGYYELHVNFDGNNQSNLNSILIKQK